MQSNRNINRRLAEYFLKIFFIWSLKIQGVENYVVFQIKDFIFNRNNLIPYHKSLYLSLLPMSQNFSLTFLESEVISPYFSSPAGPLYFMLHVNFSMFLAAEATKWACCCKKESDR